jgi:tetratricopeptide (TPR) repeat protein
MSGDLAEGVVPDLLREIYVGRRSGTLHLVRGEERQSLRFRHGHIVNAHTNVREERLGEMLVRRGLLAEADLARATEVVLQSGRRLGEVLGEMGLIDASGLEDAVALHVHEMLTRVFAWSDGTYSFAEEPEGESGGELTLKLSMGELILESVQAVRDPDVVRYALGDMDRVLVLSSDPLLRFQKLTLSPADGFVLSRVDGATSAREVVQMIPLPAEQSQKSLLGLLSTGVVEYAAVRLRDARASARPTPELPPSAPAPPVAPPPVAPPPAAPPTVTPTSATSVLPPPVASPPAASPAGARPVDDEAAERRREILDAWEGLKIRSHFEVLGLSRSVGEAEVKEAYFRLAKRFHPDVHHGASLGDLRDKLEAVFIRLGEAYDVLRDPRKRGEYEERLGRQRARPAAPPGEAGGGLATTAQPEPPAPEGPPDSEEQARLGEEAVRRAAKLLDQAKALEQEKPDQPEHQRLTYDAIQLLEPVHQTLQGKARLRAQLLLARGWGKNPKWAKRAEELLLVASRENPQSPEPWAMLGAIYAGKGLRTRATTMYRKALELKPDHEEAAQYLAANAAEPEPPEDERGGGLLGRLFRKG